jgi:hypothetical protein
MRCSIVFCLLFLFISCGTPKPEIFTLKAQFQPKKIYHISTIRGSETVINYSGEDFAMRKLKSMHIQNPGTSIIRTKTETELSTGKSTNGDCPIELVYKKAMSLDNKNEIPEGTIVKGNLDARNLPSFKTVISPELSIDQRIKLLQTLQNTFDQFRFPEKQLKVGDTLIVRRSTTMTMEGSEINTTITSNYRLLNIEENTAQFELYQTYQLTPKLIDNSFTGEGNGTGKMSYNMVNHIISEYSLNTELTINKKLDYFEFNLKTKSEFKQRTNLIMK